MRDTESNKRMPQAVGNPVIREEKPTPILINGVQYEWAELTILLKGEPINGIKPIIYKKP